MARATKKVKYECLNGPFCGHLLLLTTPTTLVFTLGSQGNLKGRYISGYLKKRTDGCLPDKFAALADQDSTNPLFVKATSKTDAYSTLIWEKH